MNDNFYPKNQIILTEKEKESFLKQLPSMVSIDPGIANAVQIVNNMPFFLTQSSCEGQKMNQPVGTHMPVPYLSIGVLYNAFDLLDELAEFLWVELRGKIHTLSIDAEVQAINKHLPTNTEVPNFQKYLSIYLKSRRGIPLLEEALKKFSKQEFPHFENQRFMENRLAERNDSMLMMTNRLMNDMPIYMNLSPSLSLQELVKNLKTNPSLSSVSLREVEENVMGNPGENYIVEFYVKNSEYNISDLFQLLCSFLTGGVIVNQSFQATSSGNYLKKVHLSLFDMDNAFLFASLTDHWANVGAWNRSPYWEVPLRK